jgi:hypothetical protein
LLLILEHIDQYSPATLLRVFEARIWISKAISRGLFCIQRLGRNDCSCCWYLWNCWPSLFNLSVYTYNTCKCITYVITSQGSQLFVGNVLMKNTSFFVLFVFVFFCCCWWFCTFIGFVWFCFVVFFGGGDVLTCKCITYVITSQGSQLFVGNVLMKNTDRPSRARIMDLLDDKDVKM